VKKPRNKTWKKVKNDAIYYTARGLFAMAGAIPIKIGLKIGAAIGASAWSVLGYERNCCMNHLRVAFPDWSEKKCIETGREAFRNLGRSFFELFHFTELLATVHDPNPYVDIRGKENLDKALENGTGVIFFTGHVGNWEIMAASLAARGYKGGEIVRNLYDPRIDKLLNDHRRRYNYRPLTRGGQDLVADIAELLSANEMLALLMDQDTKVRGVFADFFGRPAWTPSGPAYLCYMSGLDALMLTVYRRQDGGHMVEISQPVPRPQTGDAKADIAAYTQTMNGMLCDHIARHPTEWVWMHRRWKTRPKDEPPEMHPAPRPKRPWRY
jgi:Kdo2-lipid IVA lauroyltransferase/acyltransferase